jgi:hypothetical protein
MGKGARLRRRPLHKLRRDETDAESATPYMVVENLRNHILSWRIQKNFRFIKIHILCTEITEFA